MSPLLHLANFMTAAAWLLFVTSFFLPAILTGGTTASGWEAFMICFSILLNPWLWVVQPTIFLLLVFPFTNALMLASPIIRWLLRDSAVVLGVVLIPCAVLPLLIPFTNSGDLQIGFYCWNASFGIMSLACILTSVGYAAHDEEYYARLFRTHPPARDSLSRDPFLP